MKIRGALVGGLVAGACSVACPAWAEDGIWPEADLALRYRGVFLTQGSPNELMANGLEQSAHLGFLGRWDGVQGELRLSTGDPRAASTDFEPFGRFAQGAGLSLERAWVSLGEDDDEGASLIMGQWPMPWAGAGLVWDEDVDLPGFRFAWFERLNGDDIQRLGVDAGVAILSTGAPDSGDEVYLWGGQLGASFELDWDQHLTIELGYFGLNGARRLGRAIARGDLLVGLRPEGFTANTTDTDAQDPDAELTQRLIVEGLASRYHVLQAHLVWLFDEDDLPLQAELEVATNVGARGPGNGQNLALSLGATLGDASRDGEGEITLRGLLIGADATLDAFNRDLYGTNLVGGELTAKLRLWGGFVLGFEHLIGTRLNDELRGLGSGRLEPGADGLSIQLHVTASWGF
jgi:hypothetical protein